MRLNYWSCSKLADWIRGTKKPWALGLDEWDEWHRETKKARPLRYWLAEKGLRKLQNLVLSPFDVCDSIKYYLRNRLIDRLHVLRTGLKKGKWHETETRMLHGMFEALVDYVECELGTGRGRSAKRGLDHLRWEIGLKYDEDYMCIKPGEPKYGEPTPQAESAVITRDLYRWWKATRPARVEPWSDEKINYNEVQQIQDDHYKEDTEMLIRLINHRNRLWS